jgi:hypothetical protein
LRSQLSKISIVSDDRINKKQSPTAVLFVWGEVLEDTNPVFDTEIEQYLKTTSFLQQATSN